ncbi:hypothetical protein BMT55_09725 [Listeria newyorkensis]|uniref:Uncharacterized protein n=1 Tax=Listeria newyorkensis TaxID=1497681 RepID=A0ABX4XLX8_9LIST|nr:MULTISPECIES: hypothetical protein [Listeria]KGL38153.1 hypothetical protein EP56_16800 [Listeriaceae bacterium FSL A5-0209]KGL39295.1 hypothetical protein EP58_14125 [Listeria newyorkensis]PNP91974.1 hypothetical protein BMT55_09725 [Listeria newyorkensis]RQW66119.1 hypothetical protein DUK53_12295 [Listeria sp. SHR_NRA_18]WAO22242.1 hypothetical protein OTR81_02845 [Listeria newyorkensis]
MYKKWNDFYEEHPYWSVWIIVGVSSGVTILIEYIVNRDFIVSGEFLESGFYGMLFLTMGLLLLARRRTKSKK